MASRKKPPTETMSLFSAPKSEPTVVDHPTEIAKPLVLPSDPAMGASVGTLGKLRLVPRADEPEENVLVEAAGEDRFWLTFLRHNGTSRGAVLATRKQLEMLMRRIPAALEVG